MGVIQEELDLMVETELVPKNQVKAVFGRLRPTSDLPDALKNVDRVTEVVPENPKIKANVFEKMDALTPAYVSLATNASGLRAIDCAAKVKIIPSVF